jgi:hypothetical protein
VDIEFAPQKQKALSGGPGERLQKTNIGLERILSRGTKALNYQIVAPRGAAGINNPITISAERTRSAD